jgi:glycerate-2-kinase
MNKHPDKLNAALLASKLVRASVGALAVCTLLGAAVPALASGPDNPQQRKEERSDRNRNEDRERAQRDMEARAEERRRMLQDSTNNAEASRRVRMTADERRDLRRQINEAGAEVYALPPRR